MHFKFKKQGGSFYKGVQQTSPGHTAPSQMGMSNKRAGSGTVVLPPLLLWLRTLFTGQSTKAYRTRVGLPWTRLSVAGVRMIEFSLPGANAVELG